MIDYILILLILILITILFYYKKRIRELESGIRSISVRHGKLLEHYIPWIKEIFPYGPTRFRFIGDPVDGVLFDNDKILFLEFKTGKSRLSSVQKRIKENIQKGRVEWKEVRIR